MIKPIAKEIGWIGIDVAKETFDAAYHPPRSCADVPDFSNIASRSFPRTANGVKQMLKWTETMDTGCSYRIVMEATGNYSSELAVWFQQQQPSSKPAIVNPNLIANFNKSFNLRNKTDSVDAIAVARYGVERCPNEWQQPSAEDKYLKELVRERAYLVKTRTSAQNRMSELDKDGIAVDIHKNFINSLKKSIEKIENSIKKHVKNDSKLSEKTKTLMTIPGIGLITAATILGELGDLTRFCKSRSLSAFAGLSPRIHESGKSVKRSTRLCKKGPAEVRRVLYLSTMSAIRGNNDLSEFYNSLVQRGKPKMSAIGAVMRKQLVLMRALLINKTEYQNNYCKKAVKII